MSLSRLALIAAIAVPLAGAAVTAPLVSAGEAGGASGPRARATAPPRADEPTRRSSSEKQRATDRDSGQVPPGAPKPASPGRAQTWMPPVDPVHVLRGFAAPAQRWLPGHRGVDLRAATGTIVRAPAGGVVAFVGVVAGKPVVSIDHADPDGEGLIRTTYEPITSAVAAGAPIRAGEALGTVAGGSHCAGDCLHWGARRDGEYVDPLSLLRGRVRLWTPVHPTG